MLTIYYAATPNAIKAILFALEHGLDAEFKYLNLREREQFDPEFLKISPNNKVPALTDGNVVLFESGVILEYLADTHLDFRHDRERYDILKWLYWQVGGLGPMGGQNRFFSELAPERIPFAIERFSAECNRLYRVLDGHLAKNEFVSGTRYHIADMAIYPWVVYNKQQVAIAEYPNVERWFDTLSKRGSIAEAYKRFMQ